MQICIGTQSRPPQKRGLILPWPRALFPNIEKPGFVISKPWKTSQKMVERTEGKPATLQNQPDGKTPPGCLAYLDQLTHPPDAGLRKRTD
jgi:hypothetical protein